MGVGVSPRRAPLGRSHTEWPTWGALAGCYAGWLLTIWYADVLGWAFVLPAAILVTFHSSLQHEALHGHPTRSAALNEALVFPALGLLIPYRRFRQTHLRHHHDERLTDPYDDPESWYLAEEVWSRQCSIRRLLFRANATLLGRFVLGPALSLFGFYRAELRAMRAGDREIVDAWLRHGLGMIPVIGFLVAADVGVLTYLLAVAYPGLSLIMIRTFIEHRAADRPGERTAIVEADPFFSLLFLNNNLHAVHHANPTMPWYDLPRHWRSLRDGVLEGNGGYHFKGYGAVARRWLLRAREPVVHPFLRRNGEADRPE